MKSYPPYRGPSGDKYWNPQSLIFARNASTWVMVSSYSTKASLIAMWTPGIRLKLSLDRLIVENRKHATNIKNCNFHALLLSLFLDERPAAFNRECRPGALLGDYSS
jgi:hypothetical protein